MCLGGLSGSKLDYSSSLLNSWYFDSLVTQLKIGTLTFLFGRTFKIIARATIKYSDTFS
uniref:Uncharacterized protein n=1 Tax=Arion vulgaris TaxID=1028688 RepID=A0A0B6Y566_9EUPU